MTQGKRPARDLQGGTVLDFDFLFEEFDMSPTPGPTQATAEEPSQEPVNTQVHSSAPVDPSPAPAPSTSPTPRPTQESAEEPAHEPPKEPSRHPSQEPVHSYAFVNPSPVEIEPSLEAHISATVVSHRRHVLNKPPRKETQDDHAIQHVHIKRKRGDGDDGESGGGGGVRLRPKVILKPPICET
ncbi:uncharacterized protein LOC132619797 [Lycium barbarum]|uniref:uncharacterized protein LOC132619797 n=1 Tax=Lycium barbarum TaxID=112863 RepID=UPI00293E1F61|nr:uncharacterized protein LOC132619797 [Lycium barbarum]